MHSDATRGEGFTYHAPGWTEGGIGTAEDPHAAVRVILAFYPNGET